MMVLTMAARYGVGFVGEHFEVRSQPAWLGPLSRDTRRCLHACGPFRQKNAIHHRTFSVMAAMTLKGTLKEQKDEQ